MIFTWLLYIIISIQYEIPFKPKNEFEVKLNYTFKERKPDEHTTFRAQESEEGKRDQNSSGMLPYLILEVKILSAPSPEVRLKVINNLGRKGIAKKIQSGFEFEIDMGFTDDVKDRVTAHKYIVYLLNAKHEEKSMIVINVKEDGTFSINDEVRGKL